MSIREGSPNLIRCLALVHSVLLKKFRTSGFHAKADMNAATFLQMVHNTDV